MRAWTCATERDDPAQRLLVLAATCEFLAVELHEVAEQPALRGRRQFGELATRLQDRAAAILALDHMPHPQVEFDLAELGQVDATAGEQVADDGSDLLFGRQD